MGYTVRRKDEVFDDTAKFKLCEALNLVHQGDL